MDSFELWLENQIEFEHFSVVIKKLEEWAKQLRKFLNLNSPQSTLIYPPDSRSKYLTISSPLRILQNRIKSLKTNEEGSSHTKQYRLEQIAGDLKHCLYKLKEESDLYEKWIISGRDLYDKIYSRFRAKQTDAFAIQSSGTANPNKVWSANFDHDSNWILPSSRMTDYPFNRMNKRGSDTWAKQKLMQIYNWIKPFLSDSSDGEILLSNLHKDLLDETLWYAVLDFVEEKGGKTSGARKMISTIFAKELSDIDSGSGGKIKGWH